MEVGALDGARTDAQPLGSIGWIVHPVEVVFEVTRELSDSRARLLAACALLEGLERAEQLVGLPGLDAVALLSSPAVCLQGVFAMEQARNLPDPVLDVKQVEDQEELDGQALGQLADPLRTIADEDDLCVQVDSNSPPCYGPTTSPRPLGG